MRVHRRRDRGQVWRALVIFSGVATCDDFVASEVKKASKAAVALGVAEGMRGGEALELLR